MHQFVGERTGPNKIAFLIFFNIHLLISFLVYLQTIVSVVAQETNHYMQQDAQKKKKKKISHFRFPTNTNKNLYAFLAIIFQMGHDLKLCMKLYWTKDELCCLPFYYILIVDSRLSKILKYLHYADNKNPPIQD